MKKFLGGILIFLALPSAYFLVLSFAAQNTFANPSFVKSVLKKENAYEKIYTQMPEIIKTVNTNMEKGNSQSVFSKPLSDEEITTAVSKITTPKEIEGLTNNFLDSVLNWLSGRTDVLETIDVKPIKSKIDSQMKEMFRTRYESLPLCTPAQLMRAEVATTCRAKELTFDELFGALEKENGGSFTFTSVIPNEFSLEELAKGGQETKEQRSILLLARNFFEVSGWLLLVGGGISLLLWVFGARLAAGSWGKTPSVVGGSVVVFTLVGFLGNSIISIRILELIKLEIAKINGLPNLKSVLFVPLTESFVRGYSAEINKYLVAIVAFGIILMLMNVFLYLYDKLVAQKPGWSLNHK